MKQHLYQICLLGILLIITGFIAKDSHFLSFGSSNSNPVPSAVSQEYLTNSRSKEPVELVPAPSNTRESLFQRIVDSTPQIYLNTEESLSTSDGPSYIIKGGYVKDPDIFYTSSALSSTTTENDVQSFIDANASSAVSIKYSSTTGIITVVKQGTGVNKNHADVLTKFYTSVPNKISFYIDSSWQVVQDKIGLIVFQNVGQRGQNKIVLTLSKSAFVSTKDTINGDFFLTRDNTSKTWLTLDTSSTEQVLIPVSPTGYTNNGIPYFKGTTQKETRVIAFGSSDFIIVNFAGLDDASIIDSFVKRVRKN